MSEQPRWLNAKKAAERCGVSLSFIYMHVRAGKGPPCLRMGRKLQFLAHELDAWIEKQRIMEAEKAAENGQETSSYRRPA